MKKILNKIKGLFVPVPPVLANGKEVKRPFHSGWLFH